MAKLNDYEYAKLLTIKEMSEMKYMYLECIPGVLGTVLKYDLPLNDDVVEGMKDGILYHYFGDVEPDWCSSRIYDWWHGLKAESFCKKANDSYDFVNSPANMKITTLFSENSFKYSRY